MIATQEGLPVLVAHSRVEIQAMVTDALAPRAVVAVHDTFAAAEEVAGTAFGLVVLEHPLMGMDASQVVDWLRGSGAYCPFLILAVDLSESQREELGASLGDGVHVLGAVDPEAIAMAAARLAAPEGSAPSEVDEDVLSAAGNEEERSVRDDYQDDQLGQDAGETDLPSSFDFLPASGERDTSSLPEPAAEKERDEDRSPEDEEPPEESELPDTFDLLPTSGDAGRGGGEKAFEQVLETDRLVDAEASSEDLSAPAGQATDGAADPIAATEHEEPEKAESGAEEAAGSAPPPEADPATVCTLFGSTALALSPEGKASEMFAKVGAPPQLAVLLDGSRDAAAIIREAGLLESVAAGYLQLLDESGCLELVVAVPAAPAAPWRPEEPDGTPLESGEIGDKPVAELLLSLSANAFDGALVVDCPDCSMRMDIKRGHPARLAGGPAETMLGAVMRRRGILDEEGFSRVMAEQRRLAASGERVPLGDLAVRLGLVTPSGVMESVEQQYLAKIEVLLTKTEGSYRLYEQEAELPAMLPSRKPLESTIVAVLERHGELRMKLVDAFLKDHEGMAVYCREGMAETLARFRLGGRVQRLMRLCDGRSLAGLVEESPLPRIPTELYLYLFFAAGVLRVERAAVARPAPPKKKPPAPKVTPLPSRKPRPAPSPVVSPLPSRPRRPVKKPPPRRSPDLPEPPAAPLPSEVVEERLGEARALLEAKEYGQAVAVMKRLAKAAPTNADVLATLGWAIFRSQPGSDDARTEASVSLAKALEINDRHAAALVALGKINRLDGEFGQARTFLQRALAEEPENADATREIQSLNRLLGEEDDENEAEDGDTTSRFLGFLFGKKKE